MNEQLPILLVILPLIGAPACLLLNRPRSAWAFALAISGATSVISVLLLRQVLSTGPVSYMLGGWEAPWGIEYRIDPLNSYVLLIVSTLNCIAVLAAHRSLSREVAESRQVYFYTLFLLCLAGLLGATATGDVFNVFVFLEISSLSTYALIAFGRDRRALWASYQYLILGTIGTSLILIGIGFLYSMTGTLNMQDLSSRIPESAYTSTLLTAFVFLVLGLAMKLALFPLHQWLPNAYTYAPSVVTVFIAATSTKVAIYLLIRFVFTVFGTDFAGDALPLRIFFTVLGLTGIFVASFVAVYQTNIKRLFAWSSVAQIGYIIAGLGFGTLLGLQASLLHVFNHALMKGALFMALTGVMYRLGGVELRHFRGLGRRMPLTMAAITAAGLSLIGMPLTVGFVSKWHLVLAALELGLWSVALLLVAGSLIAAVYVWRIVEAAYFEAAEDSPAAARQRAESPPSILFPLWLLVFANFYFGIDTGLTIGITETASAYLVTTGAE